MNAMTETPAVSAKPRLVTGPLVRLLVASVGALSSFYLLLSVLPMLATSSGSSGSDSAAGVVTGLLMLGGVAAELASPRLMARIGGQRVLAIGLVLLGAPALLLMASDQLAVAMAVCLVRGIGFGLTMVASGSLVVAVVPPERRGEGLGLYGIAACVPGIVALPAGVWIADHAGYPVVFALAAVTAIAGLAARPGASRESDESEQPERPLACSTACAAPISADRPLPSWRPRSPRASSSRSCRWPAYRVGPVRSRCWSRR